MLLVSFGTLLLAASPVATSQQPAQVGIDAAPTAVPVSVTSSVRSTYGQVFGFDYEYNDGDAQLAQSLDLNNVWDNFNNVDLDDYWGDNVGLAVAELTSDLDGAGLVFQATANALTSGNHFQADANSEVVTAITFTAEQPVRFLLIASTASTVGYNGAEVRLRRADGSVIEQAASGPFLTAPDDVQRFGWLAAGDYTFDLHTLAGAFGTSGQLDAHTATANGALRWFQAADYDLDGDVDRHDLRTFQVDCVQGEDDADFDGNGSTDLDDLRAFARAWRRS